MMREANLRAWDGFNAEMFYSENFASMSAFWASVEKRRAGGNEVIVMHSTPYNDKQDNVIYDKDILQHESGTSYIGGKHGDETKHYVEWCSEYGGWVMYGIDVLLGDGTPSKNMLNNSYFDDRIIARCYPIEVIGNRIENPELLEELEKSLRKIRLKY